MRDLIDRRKFIKATAFSGATLGVFGSFQFAFGKGQAAEQIVVYTPSPTNSRTAYDESVVAACLQGIINRDSPSVYIAPSTSKWPEYWLETLSAKDRWLHGRPVQS